MSKVGGAIDEVECSVLGIKIDWSKSEQCNKKLYRKDYSERMCEKRHGKWRCKRPEGHTGECAPIKLFVDMDRD
jgi:hypothetical protein